MKKLAYKDPLVDREIMWGKMRPVEPKMKNNKNKVMEVMMKMKDKVVDKTSDMMSMPTRAFYGAKAKLSNMAADRTIANRNFRNRQDNTNYYRGNSYWKRNKN